MAYVPPQDRVRETSTTTGTGTLTLTATSDFRRFSDVAAVADTIDYAIVLGSAWEVGIGTIGASNTLARTVVKASSNGGTAVNFGAGVKDVFMDAGAHVLSAMVRGDVAQSLSSAQKSQARDNVLALEKSLSNAGLVATQSSPTTPAAGRLAIYADTNKTLRTKNEDGKDRGYGTVISTTTVGSGVSVADIELPPEFSSFMLLIEDLQVGTNGGQLSLLVSTNNGASYDGGASNYAYSLIVQSASALSVSTGVTTSLAISNGIDNTNSAIGGNGELKIFPGASGVTSSIHGRFVAPDPSASSVYTARQFDLKRLTGARITNIRFATAPGNFARGTFKLIGF